MPRRPDTTRPPRRERRRPTVARPTRAGADAMPAAAPAHTMASTNHSAQPCSASTATAVEVPAMPTKIALWSARRMRRQAGADQRTRWNAALVPNMTSMPATYTASAALATASGPAAMRNGPANSQATNAPRWSHPRRRGRRPRLSASRLCSPWARRDVSTPALRGDRSIQARVPRPQFPDRMLMPCAPSPPGPGRRGDRLARPRSGGSRAGTRWRRGRARSMRCRPRCARAASR